MSEQPLISVIVPIYKVESYLDRCVQSIVDQTYENLEIILVDDGSPDNCPAMCDAWAAKDGRVQVIHKENGGVSSARNAGLDMATGSYITFADADDWLEPAAVAILLEQAVSTGADIVVGNYYFDYVDGRSAQALTAEKQIWKQDEIVRAYVMDHIRPEACNKLYTGASIGNLRFDPSIGYGEDLLFNYYALSKARVVAQTDVCCYHYLQASGNSSTTAYMTKNRAESYRVTAEIVKDLRETPFVSLAVWRHVRTVYALLSRVCNTQGKAYFEPYFAIYRDEILMHKSEVLGSAQYSVKQKVATALLWMAPKAFVQISKRLL